MNYSVSLESVPLDSKSIDHQRDKIKNIKTIIKNVINNSDQVTWDRTTAWYEFTKYLLRDIRNPQFANKFELPNNISNAFVKCLELLKCVTLQKPVLHLDNASLPGDFIRATNWYTGVRNVEYDWRGYSYFEDKSIGDRFNLVRQYPDKWIPGGGDLTKIEDIIAVKKWCDNNKWYPNLYTSDLGFKMGPDHIECDLHHIGNVGQILCGLLVLSTGGNMVIKQFIPASTESQVLLSLVRSCFKSMHIVKPLTSKKDNAEIYLVCLGHTPDSKVTDQLTKVMQGIKDDQTVQSIPVNGITILDSLIESQIGQLTMNKMLFQSKKRVTVSNAVIGMWIKDFLISSELLGSSEHGT